MRYDMQTDVLAQWYTSQGAVMQFTKFSEVQYHEMHSLTGRVPSIAHGPSRTKFVIGVAFRDGAYMDDIMINAFSGYKNSNEPWRKNVFHVSLESYSRLAQDVKKLLYEYRVYFEDDYVGPMTAWIDDRVEHEVNEYKKWCKEQCRN